MTPGRSRARTSIIPVGLHSIQPVTPTSVFTLYCVRACSLISAACGSNTANSNAGPVTTTKTAMLPIYNIPGVCNPKLLCALTLWLLTISTRRNCLAGAFICLVCDQTRGWQAGVLQQSTHGCSCIMTNFSSNLSSFEGLCMLPGAKRPQDQGMGRTALERGAGLADGGTKAKLLYAPSSTRAQRA